MPCSDLGVLLDTCVFVTNLLHETSSSNILTIIKNEGMYIVVCTPLYDEYVKQVLNRFVPLRYYLDYMITKLSESDILYWSYSPENTTHEIVSRKDQPHVNCAVNSERVVHIIVTPDSDHYQFVNAPPKIPKIIHPDIFVDSHERENICRDIKQGR